MTRDIYFLLLLVSILMAFQAWIYHLDLRYALQLASSGDIAVSKAFDLIIQQDNQKGNQKK